MLRKSVVLAVSLLVLAVPVTGAVAGSPRTERVETGEYLAGGLNGALGIGAQGQVNIGAVYFPSGNERFLSVAIEDVSGGSIWGRVTQDFNGDDLPDLTHELCGSTDAPVKIHPGVEVIVVIYNGVCPLDNSPSFATSGTVTGTFSNKR